MKKSTAIVLGVVATAAGFAGGYVFGFRKGVKATRQACQEEIDEVREIYRNKCERKGIDPEIVEKDIIDVDNEAPVNTVIETPKPIPQPVKEALSDYGVDDIESDGIQIITEEEYEETCDPREPVGRHVEISYTGNGHFVHSNGNPADPRCFNGERVVEYFNEGDGTDVVYVHNIEEDIYYLISDDTSQNAEDYLVPKNKGSTHGKFD